MSLNASSQRHQLVPTPWDSATFGRPTWEISTYSASSIDAANGMPGHQTIKLDPLADKELLHRNGFYYCDTLMTPSCKRQSLRTFRHEFSAIGKTTEYDYVKVLASRSFTHGRFHRDFLIPKKDADKRYENWVSQLLDHGDVYTLYWEGAPAGFIACIDNRLVLHAIDESFRGKGLAKFWWTRVCEHLFVRYPQIESSVSASNLRAINLYASLGFTFKAAQDVYHRVVEVG